MRDEFLDPGGRRPDELSDRGRAAAPPPRRVRRPGRAQGAPRRSSSRRPAAGARPPTTCCSPGRPASARPRWPTSSPPRWASQLQITSGPALERAGDLAAILTKLDEGDVLFIDEIHRLSRAVEEILYPAMEDFQLDIVRGQGPGGVVHPPRRCPASPSSAPPPARASSPGRCATASGSWPGSTTTTPPSSQAIVDRAPPASSASHIDDEGAAEIAGRSRGTPRIANRLLRRVRDFAEVRADGAIDVATARDGPGAVRGRRARPRQGRPRHPRRAVPPLRRRPGRACPRWPSASARSPRRSRTCTSRSSSRRAC